MNLLLTDPRITVLFDRWRQQTGLYRAADTVARAADDLAHAARVSHWMDRADDPYRNLSTCTTIFRSGSRSFPGSLISSSMTSQPC